MAPPGVFHRNGRSVLLQFLYRFVGLRDGEMEQKNEVRRLNRSDLVPDFLIIL